MPTPIWLTRTHSTTKPDPYLVALAVERARAGDEVRVATNDGDLRTACTDFGIVVETAAEFVAHVRA